MKSQAVVLGLALCGFSSFAMAHTTGFQNLGSGLSSKDIFRVMCFSWGNSIHPAAPPGENNGAAVRFMASLPVGSNPALRIQALPGGIIVAPGGTSISTVGNGVHYIVVSHVNAVLANYEAHYDCTNAAAVFTGVGEGFTGNPPNVLPTLDFIKTQNQ